MLLIHVMKMPNCPLKPTINLKTFVEGLINKKIFKFYNLFKNVQLISVLHMTKDFKNMVESFQIYKILTSQANKHNFKG